MRRRLKGFTIIELIGIIVLIGIVGVVVTGRFLRPNKFDEAAAADGLLTTIRAAQQAALGRSAVTFEVGLAGGEWLFMAKSGANTLRTFRVPAESVLLETGAPASSGDTCATGFDTALDPNFQLAFDDLGNLASFTNGLAVYPVDASFNGVRLCVNDTVAVSACVSPAGYAYAGNCDD